jgi:hypothetical protein
VALIHAVASVAGYCMLGPPQVDDDSVDLALGATRKHGSKRRAPRVDVQVKCTETDDGAGDTLAYPLPMKNYDDLRMEGLHVPHILVVLCVPTDLDQWLHETAEQTALRRVAYWRSLRGEPAVPNDATKAVHIPRVQRFTVAALKAIMTRIGEGAPP